MQLNANLQEVVFALTAFWKEVIEFSYFNTIIELRHLKPPLYVHMKQPEVTLCFLREHQQPIRFTRQLRLHDVPNP